MPSEKLKMMFADESMEEIMDMEDQIRDLSKDNEGRPFYNRRYLRRNRLSAAQNLYDDYFSEDPLYNSDKFRRRFRMNRSLFLKITAAIEDHDDYFKQKRDCCGKLGFSSIQKATAALRMLSYGISADYIDEYMKMSEVTALEALKHFCKAIIAVFGDTYLRQPNNEDLARLLEEGERRGFPGMLGSLDCMHWTWKNCPAAWKGQYQGRSKEPTLILEAVASKDLWIWHSSFGFPGSMNDINVLNHSGLFDKVTNGIASEISYQVNNNTYNFGYYLADGIYPSYATLIKSINPGTDEKKMVKHIHSLIKVFLLTPV